MTAFATLCGIQDAARLEAIERTLLQIKTRELELVRIGWCDLHGIVRGKTLVASALPKTFHEGVSMVSTLMLKDTSDRTAFKVFEPEGTSSLPGFGQGGNLLLLPDPDSFQQLPWTDSTGWLRAQPWLIVAGD